MNDKDLNERFDRLEQRIEDGRFSTFAWLMLFGLFFKGCIAP